MPENTVERNLLNLNNAILALEYQQKHGYALSTMEFKAIISEEEFNKLYLKLISILKITDNVVMTLLSKGKFRLQKKIYDLPRTIQIYQDNIGSYVIAFEAKRSIAGGDKVCRSKVKGGTYKSFSKAFILNLPKNEILGDIDNQLASLVMRNYDDETGCNYIEADITHETSAGVKLYYFAYENKDIKKLAFYGKMGTPLFDYFNDSNLYNSLTIQDKQDIFNSIVNQLYILHNAKIIHQDIKPDNIIVYYNKAAKKYYTKLNDFGISNKLYNKALATIGYESPEMVEGKFISKNYNFRSHNVATLSMRLYNLNYRGINSRFFYSLPNSSFFPSRSNDMWALGVVYFQLMYSPNIANNMIQISDENLTELKFIGKLDKIIQQLLIRYEKRTSIAKLMLYLQNSQTENNDLLLYTMLNIGNKFRGLGKYASDGEVLNVKNKCEHLSILGEKFKENIFNNYSVQDLEYLFLFIQNLIDQYQYYVSYTDISPQTVTNGDAIVEINKQFKILIDYFASYFTAAKKVLKVNGFLLNISSDINLLDIICDKFSELLSKEELIYIQDYQGKVSSIEDRNLPDLDKKDQAVHEAEARKLA